MLIERLNPQGQLDRAIIVRMKDLRKIENAAAVLENLLIAFEEGIECSLLRQCTKEPSEFVEEPEKGRLP
jgi:hypothetical protein